MVLPRPAPIGPVAHDRSSRATAEKAQAGRQLQTHDLEGPAAHRNAKEKNSGSQTKPSYLAYPPMSYFSDLTHFPSTPSPTPPAEIFKII